MKSFAGIAVAAVALIGVFSTVEASPVLFPGFGGLLSPPPLPSNGNILFSADLDLYFDLVEATSIVFDTIVAKLAPIVIAILPVLLPLVEKFIECLLNC